MFTTKHHVCEKCGHSYRPADSPAFVKQSISPCPNCGSGNIAIVDSEKQAKNKSDKIKETVKSVKMGVTIKKVNKKVKDTIV